MIKCWFCDEWVLIWRFYLYAITAIAFQHDHIYPVRSRDKYSTPDIIGSYFIPVRFGQYQRFFTFKLAREVDDLANPSELNAGLKMCFINLDICNRIALRDTDLRSDLVKIKNSDSDYARQKRQNMFIRPGRTDENRNLWFTNRCFWE